jgi:DNA-binding PadR family transcriptional regulator
MSMADAIGRLRSGDRGWVLPQLLRMAMASHGGHGAGPFGFGDRTWGGLRGGFPFGGFPGRMFGHGPKRKGHGDVRGAILILLTERPMHGYQIIQEIGERSGGLWTPSPGSVYPALQQLEDEGLVRIEQAEGRKVVHLTDGGLAYVQGHREELGIPWEMATEGFGEEFLELRSLIGQVAMATMQVAQAGSNSQIAEARRLLADVRRQLYRILAEDDSTSLE